MWVYIGDSEIVEEAGMVGICQFGNSALTIQFFIVPQASSLFRCSAVKAFLYKLVACGTQPNLHAIG